MALRIACDLDGTVADMDAALQEHATTLFGRDVTLRGGLALDPLSAAEGVETGEVVIDRGKGLSRREARQLWDHVAGVDNFWLGLKEIEPGSIARLAALAAANQWEILFITQRPATAGETAQVQTQRWLRAQGYDLPSVFVMNGSRGKLAAALHLDAVVDDRSENCLDVATASKARPMLVWRSAPNTAPPGAKNLGIHIVFSFAEALDELESMTANLGKRPSIMSRIRDAIGI